MWPGLRYSEGPATRRVPPSPRPLPPISPIPRPATAVSNGHNEDRLAVGPVDDVVRKAFDKSATMDRPERDSAVGRGGDFVQCPRHGFLEPVSRQFAAAVIP